MTACFLNLRGSPNGKLFLMISVMREEDELKPMEMGEASISFERIIGH
jgi:hypothetical protein